MGVSLKFWALSLPIAWGMASPAFATLPITGCGKDDFPKLLPATLPVKLRAFLPKSTGKDADAPAGAVNDKLTPVQVFAIECYIGSAVPGGYARNLYEGPDGKQRPNTDYDTVANLKTKRGNTITPRYYVIKEMLGPELERTKGDGKEGFAETFDRALADLKSEKPKRSITAWSKELAAMLSVQARALLDEKKVDYVAGVANFLAIRMALKPVEGGLVRGVTGGELGLEKGKLPPIGEPIPFSSSKGTVISTNPAEFLTDTVDYVMGKVNSNHPRHGGKDAYVIVYPPDVVEGISIKSLPDGIVDSVERHLATNLNADGTVYRDPSVVVSKREVLASPKEDLVVRGYYRTRKNPGLIYVVMGKKGSPPLGENWED